VKNLAQATQSLTGWSDIPDQVLLRGAHHFLQVVEQVTNAHFT